MGAFPASNRNCLYSDDNFIGFELLAWPRWRLEGADLFLSCRGGFASLVMRLVISLLASFFPDSIKRGNGAVEVTVF